MTTARQVRLNPVRLILFQLNFVNKAFWRNPASAFFTFAFPLMFLVIFSSLLGNGEVLLDGRQVHLSTYYVAEMGAFALITACYNNIATSLAFQRDNGVLKRTDGTPLPAWIYFTSRVLHALLIAVLLVAITVAFGRLVFQADVPTGLPLLQFLVMLTVGSMSFCALGFATTTFVPNADAAAVVVNAVIMPLLFLSGVFIPIGDKAPAWIIWIGRIFPVKYFATGMQAGFLGTTFHWTDILIVAAWGLAGLLVAVRWFSWEPKV